MAPLPEDMESLGTKHHKFNNLVNKTMRKSFDVILNETGNTDIDNLYKIHIAGFQRNVKYILETLKSGDMLFVSHAIKTSIWLFTDRRYSNIINPHYLYNDFFPFVSTKVIQRLLFSIRIHLKDEIRVEAFYKYYEEKDDIRTALKWLPECSIPFIEGAIVKHKDKIGLKLFKHLCQRSFTVFETFFKYYPSYKGHHVKATVFLINTDCEEYMKLVDSFHDYECPSFGEKHTAIILKKCPKVIDNFEKYASRLHLVTLAKHLGPNKIKDYLLRHSKNRQMYHWFTFENLKPFIEQLHEKERFEFVKEVFVDKAQGGSGDEPTLYEKYVPLSEAYQANVWCSAQMYKWYQFAPFLTAFLGLKELIKSESSPDTRLEILKEMIICARHNFDNIHTVLKYFREKHINETLKFKNSFIHGLLSSTKTHKFNDETWKILDELFYSIEVYFESENDVEKCAICIIVYKILHKQPIPEILEKKIKFTSFDCLKLKTSDSEKDQIFKYLYNILEKRINLEKLENESSFNSSVNLQLKMLQFLKEANKDIADYPTILERIKKFVEIKKENGWNTNICPLFNVKKSWKKLMIEESLALGRGADACLNALKHDPTLLVRRSDDVQKLCRNDKVRMDCVISKLRVYGPQTIIAKWTASYRAELQQPPISKAIVRGLCLLLPPSELEPMLNEHAPSEPKIQWSEIDEMKLGLQKYLAQTMYCARPMPSLQAVLQYAVGDYLPFALPSLTAILHNLNEKDSRMMLPHLLTTSKSISLQKHGIRFAFIKMKTEELKEIFSKIWTTTKNMTIRAVVFELTYKLLCKEKNPQRIDDLWKLLEVFIENLSSEENRKIYTLMKEVHAVPIAVRAKFCMKSYKMLKSLPPNANCESFVKTLAHSTHLLMDTIDPDFVADIILEHVNNYYVKKSFMTEENSYGYACSILEVISAFILHCKDEDVQMQRYQQVLVPIINHSVDTWNEKKDNKFVIKNYLKQLLQNLADTYAFMKNGYVIPIKLAKELKKDIEKHFAGPDSYYIFTYWSIYVCLLESFVKVELPPTLVEDDTEASSHCIETQLSKEWADIVPVFTNMCIQLLKEDIEKYFPSIHIYFGKVLKEFLNKLPLGKLFNIALAKEFMLDNASIPGFLLALKIIPTHIYENNLKKEYSEIRKKILLHPSAEVKIHYYRKFSDSAEEDLV